MKGGRRQKRKEGEGRREEGRGGGRERGEERGKERREGQRRRYCRGYHALHVPTSIRVTREFEDG